MNFIQSVKTCFRTYAVFKGRATRSEFWWFQLFVIIFTFAAYLIDISILGFSPDATVSPVSTLSMALLALPSLSVMARRLHDIGWSGWVQLPVLLTYSVYVDLMIPNFSISTMGTALMGIGILTWLVILLILIRDSQQNTNKYGPNPKNPDMGEVFS